MKKFFPLVLLSAFLLVGCTSKKPEETHQATDMTATPQASTMVHSTTISSEKDFILGMIPHHQEAIDTSKVVLAQTTDSEMKKFAQGVITVQEKEVNQMKGWLKSWYNEEYVVNFHCCFLTKASHCSC